MCADLMMEYDTYPILSVFGWQSNIDLVSASLHVIVHTSGSNLVFREIKGYIIQDVDFIQVLQEELLCFLNIYNFS
jgi:hypothetical protein